MSRMASLFRTLLSALRWMALLVLAAGSLMGARAASAAVATFTPASGDYATATNWSTATIPGNGNNDEPRIGVGVTRAATYSTATSYTTASRFIVGINSGGDGKLTLNGSAGTLTFGGDNFNNANYVGVDGGTGELKMDSGTITLTGAAGLNIGCNSGTPVGTVTVNGGVINVGNRLLAAANNTAAVATVKLNGGVLNVGTGSGSEQGFYRVGSGTSTLDLDAGTLSLFRFYSDNTDATKAVVNFNGATVQALATMNSPGFFTGNFTTNVKDGGAIFDTNSFDITVGQALLHGTGATTDGLTKTGGGTLTLSSGASSYTGNVLVSQGTLNAAGTTGGMAPTTGSLGNSQTVGRTITAGSGGTLRFSNNDILGNHVSAANVQVVINAGGLVENGGVFNTLNNLALNGGELRANGGASANFPAYQLKGTVTVGGGSASTITSNTSVNAFNRLQIGDNTVTGFTTFNVADATGNASSDLIISAQLSDGRNAGNSADVASGLIKTGGGTLELSGANMYTGNTTVSAGILKITGTASNTTTGGTYVLNGELQLGKTGGAYYTNSTTLQVGDGSGATGTAIARLLANNQTSPSGIDVTIFSDGVLNLNGFNETINNLLDDSSGLSIVDGGSGSPTLTVGGGDFRGAIQDTAGNLALTKNTGSALTLRHVNNTYSGNTTISGGSLQLVNSGTNNNIASSPVIDVQSGATLNVTGLDGGPLNTLDLASGQVLKGSGTVVGNVTVGGGIVAPGSSPGLLTINGNQTWNTGDTYEWEAAQAGVAGVDYDSINVNDTLTFGSSGILLDLIKWPGGDIFATDTFVLWSYDTLVGWDAAVLAPSSLFSVDLGIFHGTPTIYATNLSGPGQIILTGIYVPEPSTYALGLVGLVALACRAWAGRRKRQLRIVDCGLRIADLARRWT